MPQITVAPIEEALRSKSSQPARTTLQGEAFADLATQILDGIKKTPTEAQVIDFGADLSEELWQGVEPASYVSRLRSAILRQGQDYEDEKGRKHSGNALASEVVVKLVRNQPKAVVLKMRPEDRANLERLRERGRALYAARMDAEETPAPPPPAPRQRGGRSRAA